MAKCLDRVLNPSETLRPIPFLVFALLLGLISACDECETAADCAVGSICQAGDCISVEGSDTDSDSDSDSDSDMDADTDSDVDTDTDSDTDSDTGTGELLLENGEECDADNECRSDHCGDGFCCADGECCGTVGDASDCDTSLCVQRYCDGNFQCVYHDLECAVVDSMDGDLCEDPNRCDGFGGCAELGECNAAYAHDSTYTCTVGEVEEDCHDSCVDVNHCNTGYFCSAESMCLEFLQAGQGGCSANAHCLSGYCELDTGVCCDPGIGVCCNAGEQCAPFGCNTSVFACYSSCNPGTGDSDAMCDDGYHCDGGWCFEDFGPMEPCDEDSDCATGYCHPTFFFCFVGDCSPGGVEDDSLCESLGDYHCDGDACLPDIVNGDNGCDENTDCKSGECDTGNGICCDDASKGCCASPADCNDSEICTTDYCTAGNYCYNAPRDDGDECSDDLYCNGLEKCQGGVCQPGVYPCTGGNVCVQDECIEDNNPPCVYTPVGNGTYCSDDPLACLDNERAQCFGGVCGPSRASGYGPEGNCGDTGNLCTRYECNLASGNCDSKNESNVTSCDDSDPCNGDDQCYEGNCEHEGNPCYDGDPCTTDTCTPNGEDPDCTYPAISDGNQCEEGICAGTQSATRCWGGECVMDPGRECVDSNICTIESCIDNDGVAVCNHTIDNPESNIIDLTCNSTTDVSYNSFITSDYYTISGCGTHAGREAIVRINPTSPNVTITAPTYSSSWTHTFSILKLGDSQSITDFCSDTAPCTNVTGVPQSLAVGTDNYFVLDYVEARPAPTTNVSIQVTCF